MKTQKSLLYLLITTLGINCFSQISYEKGYFIDNDNQKTDCFIKNLDWRNNPIEFEYKLTTEDNSKKTNYRVNTGIWYLSKLKIH